MGWRDLATLAPGALLGPLLASGTIAAPLRPGRSAILGAPVDGVWIGVSAFP